MLGAFCAAKGRYTLAVVLSSHVHFLCSCNRCRFLHGRALQEIWHREGHTHGLLGGGFLHVTYPLSFTYGI